MKQNKTGLSGASRREFLQWTGAAGLSLSAGGFLAACGGGDDAAPSRGGEVAGTISFMKGPFHDKDAAWQTGYAKAFKQVHPQVTVEPRFFDWGTIDADLTAAYASGSPPDVAYLVSRVWGKFADVGALMDMTDLVKDPSFAKEYAAVPESLWDSITYKGKIYGVPIFGAVQPVYVNLDLLRASGHENWNESYDTMYEAAKVNRRGDVYGFIIPQTLVDLAPEHYQSYLTSAGANLFDASGEQAAVANPVSIEQFDLLRRLHEDGIAPKPGLYDAEGQAALFRAGRVAIAHLNLGQVQPLLQKPPSFEWALALPPAGPAGQTASGDYGYMCIAAGTKSKEAAWEYVKYLTSRSQVRDYMLKLDRTFQMARSDLTEDLFPEKSSPGKTLQEFAGKVVPYAPGPKQYDATKLLETEYEAIIRGKTPTATGLQDADAAITQILSS